VKTLVVPEGGELPPEDEEPVVAAAEPQVPEDAFDRAVDGAVEAEGEEL
jgi:hypothetical protein